FVTGAANCGQRFFRTRLRHAPQLRDLHRSCEGIESCSRISATLTPVVHDAGVRLPAQDQARSFLSMRSWKKARGVSRAMGASVRAPFLSDQGKGLGQDVSWETVGRVPCLISTTPNDGESA